MAEDDKNPVSGTTAGGRKREQSEGVRFVSKAPPPIEPVGTYGLALHRVTVTQIPPDPPSDMPSDLWPSTLVILAKARKTFADRRQISGMCLHVTSEMTPLLLSAVRTGRIKPHQALRVMEGVLHSILVHNDDGAKGGFASLSDQAYRIEQVVRNSDAWLDFATAIAGEIGEPNASSAANKGEDRREEIKAFIVKVSLEAGRQIHKKDISTVAGYRNTTDFQRFQRNDRRTTTIAIGNFQRVLTMEAKSFIAALNAKEEQQKRKK